jgi:thioredoxin reductase (NADPH)
MSTKASSEETPDLQGAFPRLGGLVDLDDHGFIRTGSPGAERSLLETSRPGIFAVGDVRAGSAKRVATAVGEGAMAIRLAFERTRPT